MDTLSIKQAISSSVSIEAISISSILGCSTQIRHTCHSVADLQVYEETALSGSGASCLERLHSL